MALDANVTGTLVNVLSTLIVAIVLTVFRSFYKTVKNLLVATKTNSWAIRAIVGYLSERDGFKLPPRFGDE